MWDEEMVNIFQTEKKDQLFGQDEEDNEENHHQAMLKLKERFILYFGSSFSSQSFF